MKEEAHMIGTIAVRVLAFAIIIMASVMLIESLWHVVVAANLGGMNSEEVEQMEAMLEEDPMAMSSTQTFSSTLTLVSPWSAGIHLFVGIALLLLSKPIGRLVARGF